jgi:oligopeptide/dipeptide ABC transporter ATP-binding protein
MNKAINIKGLTVDYRVENGCVHALRGIDLDIEAGGSVAIVGESGCGKTTLALSMINLLAANAEINGSVLINGREVAGKTNSELESIRGVEAGIIFQDPAASLNPVFTIKEQLEETMRNHLKIKSRVELKERSIKLLTDVGIDEAQRVYNSYPHQLSGGQQQRVMTAIALCCGPGILIADEPTTALDVTVQAQIIGLLKKLKIERNLTLVLITHDLHLAAELCDRVVVMYAGEIVEDGHINNEKAARHPYTKALFEIIPDIKGKKKEFKVIPGSVPDLHILEKKCSFYGRCGRRRDECAADHPNIENGVRCLYPFKVENV